MNSMRLTRAALGKGVPMKSTDAPPALLLTAKEASRLLAVSARTLWSMTASHEIPHIRLGRSVRYPLTELERWIAARIDGGQET